MQCLKPVNFHCTAFRRWAVFLKLERFHTSLAACLHVRLQNRPPSRIIVRSKSRRDIQDSRPIRRSSSNGRCTPKLHKCYSMSTVPLAHRLIALPCVFNHRSRFEIERSRSSAYPAIDSILVHIIIPRVFRIFLRHLYIPFICYILMFCILALDSPSTIVPLHFSPSPLVLPPSHHAALSRHYPHCVHLFVHGFL